MNFEEMLQHHLLDHTILPLATIGGIHFGITKHLVMMWIASAVLLATATWAARSTSGAGKLVRGGMEAIVIFIRDEILHPIFHEHTHFYLPYFLTLFFFIFLCNIAGLFPGGATATGNISVTAALSICTFGLMQFAGIKEQGLFSYIKHIAPGGIPAPVLVILYPIEILGMLVKCVALTIRLFANMIAGHIVALSFLSLIFIFGAMSKPVGLAVAFPAVGLALFINTLDVLVSLLQAYIFTMLTALFVGASVHPH
ncbi:MAG: F0F1 ATP synthase subunit A [Elusimicrobia bacterium]|nr:F0F1 ATP synthase subunit A [Elusimicrobiota bacterium]